MVLDDEQVFGILRLRRLCEVERPRDDDLAVDYHDLVVRDRVNGINPGRNASMDQKGHAAITFRTLALVEDYPHVHTPVVGGLEGTGDRCGRETVGQDQDGLLGVADGGHHGIRAAAVGAKVDLGRGIPQDEVRRV